MGLLAGLAAGGFILGAGYTARRLIRARRLAYIDRYVFHEAIQRRVKAKRPALSAQDVDLVMSALRDYFHLCGLAGKRMVSMPSQVVDDAWHEFILFTRAYGTFCSRAFGRFLHHTPAEAMRTPTQAQEGIRRAWRLACAKEGIDPRAPDRLPLLFAIDALLNVEGGFRYALDCRGNKAGRGDFCGSHIGCASGCGGDFGGEGSDGFFGGSVGGGGGDGGAGCGGGGD